MKYRLIMLSYIIVGLIHFSKKRFSIISAPHVIRLGTNLVIIFCHSLVTSPNLYISIFTFRVASLPIFLWKVLLYAVKLRRFPFYFVSVHF